MLREFRRELETRSDFTISNSEDNVETGLQRLCDGRATTFLAYCGHQLPTYSE